MAVGTEGLLLVRPMLIDRYIARAQLHAFVILFISLAGLTFVVDAFTNIEEFISHGAEAGGLWRVLGTYYGCLLYTSPSPRDS